MDLELVEGRQPCPADPPVLVSVHGGSTVVSLNGELTIAEAPQLLAAAIAALELPNPIVIDWAGTQRVDASAVQILAALAAELGTARRNLSGRDSSELVTTYLRIAGYSALGSPPAAPEDLFT